MTGLIDAHKHGIRALAAEEGATPQLQRLANAPKRIKGSCTPFDPSRLSCKDPYACQLPSKFLFSVLITSHMVSRRHETPVPGASSGCCTEADLDLGQRHQHSGPQQHQIIVHSNWSSATAEIKAAAYLVMDHRRCLPAAAVHQMLMQLAQGWSRAESQQHVLCSRTTNKSILNQGRRSNQLAALMWLLRRPSGLARSIAPPSLGALVVLFCAHMHFATSCWQFTGSAICARAC